MGQMILETNTLIQDCKNVWSALAGLEGWSASGNSDMNPDLANGPRNTYGLTMLFLPGNAIRTGSFEMPESESGADFLDHRPMQSSRSRKYILLVIMSYGITYSTNIGITQAKRGLS